MNKIISIEPFGLEKDIESQFNKILVEKGYKLIVSPKRLENDTAIIEFAHDATVLITSNIPISSIIIEQCPKLKMIAVAFTGVDHIDLKTCKNKNITVCNAAGYATQAVAELTIGLIITVLRKISELDLKHKKVEHRQGFLGSELSGKTVGIIGYGAIGSRVGKLLHGFDCHILAYSRTLKTENKFPIQFVPLNELLQKSDVVSLHVPLTSETRGLIDKTKLQLMKPHAILINCARGPVIKTDDLIWALHNKIIAGAGLDVFDTEPPLEKNHPLFETPNLVMTPHIAYATNEAMIKRFQIVQNNILAWIDGKPVNVVQ